MMHHQLMSHPALNSIVYELRYGLRWCLVEAREQGRVLQQASSCHDTVDTSLLCDSVSVLYCIDISVCKDR